MRGDGSRRKLRLSADDIDELMENTDDEKVRRFWQTIKAEKLRGGIPGINAPKGTKFLSIPLYNNSIAIIFILAILSFSTWFLFSYTRVNLPVDITRSALVLVFAFSAIMFYRSVSEKNEIVGMLDQLAGYSVQNDSIIENIGSALIVVDAAGIVTKANQKAKDILEAEVSDLVGKSYQDMFGNRELVELLIHTLRSGRSVINHEIEWKSSNGHHYSLQVTTSLLKNKNGHTIGAVEVINDVTEICELQEKLRLNEHLASIGELSAKLSHEIGNSLGGIKLFTDNLLEEIPTGDHRREYAEEILSEIDRLESNVLKLKAYSRPISLDLKKAVLNALVDEVLSYTRDKIQDKGISVKRVLSPELPEIMIDHDQVKGALLNVVINAIQAMTRGGELTVSTRQMNGAVELSVSDTGPGIPEEIRGKIFNPFFTTKRALGTGLGLSIVYKAIQAHGGTIKCDSELGHGTTFTIELPMKTPVGEHHVSAFAHF